MVAMSAWEWKRKKMSLEWEVATLRWTVLGLALAWLLFAAQAQIRLQSLSSQLSKSSHESLAMPQFPQKP